MIQPRIGVIVKKQAFFKLVGPYAVTFAVLVLAALLVFVIYYTRLDLPWIAFLTGVLAAAILGMVSRASKAEWIIARREAKISLLQEKLTSEIRLRRQLERMLADSKPLPQEGQGGEPETANTSPEPAPDADSAAQDMFMQSLSEEITGQDDAIERILFAIERILFAIERILFAIERILFAIERNEFCLYCQHIVPLAPNAGQDGHYELLIRLQEEEEGMIPPGAFFPMVEKHGLMPHLDRWVVQHVIEWIAAHPSSTREHSAFFINLATVSLDDSDFARFILDQLRLNKVPAQFLCFEITSTEMSLRHDDAAAFSRKMRDNGCHIALSNFGRDGVLFQPLNELHADFLKIDGSIVLDLLRDPADLAQAVAIARVAKSIGVKTVAELVESDACMTKLREIGVDYGQGFGISTPVPLETLR